jgi:DNA excision repair protein ERCC-2
MKMIHSTFTQTNPEIDTIIQNPGMTEEQRTEFLSNFLTDNSATLAGFAVMGGVFGEGIDLVGERLSGAVIYGVGLPALSPERDLIRDYFSDMEGAGYEYAYLFPGINRVLQAAGRVIRSDKDRGIVVLIDDRFRSPRYKSLFPKEWKPVRVDNMEYLSRILKDFWNEKPRIF